MEAADELPVTTLISGLGGQGVVLAGDTLAEAALLAGLNVKKSEIHGLSRRFGSVSCQVRIGPNLYSPLRGHGSVDLLLSLEGFEGLRHLPFLMPDGTALINRLWRNPRALTSADEVTRHFVSDPRIEWFDGSDFTHQAECPRSLNFLMLGVLSTRLAIPDECWDEALRSAGGGRAHEANREMFALGCRLVTTCPERAVAALAG
jgi:indolepyruvate ferredoxin oxidoreductase beta subunit